MSLPSTSYLPPTQRSTSSTLDIPRPSKRALRPTQSDSNGIPISPLTSSELAAVRYGVDGDMTLKLANIGPHIRSSESPPLLLASGSPSLLPPLAGVTGGYQQPNALASTSSTPIDLPANAFPSRQFTRAHSYSTRDGPDQSPWLSNQEVLLLAKQDVEWAAKRDAELAEMARRLKPQGPLRRMGEIGMDTDGGLPMEMGLSEIAPREAPATASSPPGPGRGKKRDQTDAEDEGEATDVDDDGDMDLAQGFDARPSFLRPYGALKSDAATTSQHRSLRPLPPGGRKQTMLRQTKSMPAPRHSRQRNAALAGWDEDDAMDGGQDGTSDLSRWVGRTDF